MNCIVMPYLTQALRVVHPSHSHSLEPSATTAWAIRAAVIRGNGPEVS
ncbi:MAG: hypothetical protein WCI09_12605 [Planctomycetota bacterium]